MHQTAREIVSLFRKRGCELPTSAVVASVFPAQEILEERAQLHRRTLHHLHQLVQRGVLRVVKHGLKGERYFALNVGDGEELIALTPDMFKRVVATRPSQPAVPIEGYEQNRLVHRFGAPTWIERSNAFVIRTEQCENYQKLFTLCVEKVFPLVNDAVALYGFARHLNKGESNSFLTALAREGEDYGKIITIDIDLSELTPSTHTDSFISWLAEHELASIRVCIGATGESLTEHATFVQSLIAVLAKKKGMLYIRNCSKERGPHFVGNAGPYCFTREEWMHFITNHPNTLCVGCAQSSLIVDIGKFFSEYGASTTKLVEIMRNCARAILIANSHHRRKGNEQVHNLQEQADPFKITRNYIRLWNYGLFQEDTNPAVVQTMLYEVKKKIDAFCAGEETIYKSCGMSTRFKLAFAPAFASAGTLSSASYGKLQVTHLQDFENKTIVKALRTREHMKDMFSGGDEITVHYAGEPNPEAILAQFKHLLEHYSFPLCNYSFKRIAGDLKLTDFL